MSKTINISVYDLESMEKEIEELKKENKKLKEDIKFYRWKWKQNKYWGWYFTWKLPKKYEHWEKVISSWPCLNEVIPRDENWFYKEVKPTC